MNYGILGVLLMHGGYLENADKQVIYLSRLKEIKHDGFRGKKIIYFSGYFSIFLYLVRKKQGTIYAPIVYDVILSYLINLFGSNKRIIYWVRGLVDEEDYHMFGKRFRYKILHFLMKFSLKVSDKIIVVTDNMFKVLVESYKCHPQKEYIVIPSNSRLIYTDIDRVKNSICYIGGLNKWQNIDKILLFFNKLCTRNSDFKLFIATYDQNKAKQLIDIFVDKEYQSNVYLKNIKEKKDVSSFLSSMEYGMLMRDDILLNQVASPIKLAEYLSCGVNPIISKSLIEFTYLITNNHCGILIDEKIDDAISEIINHRPNAQNAINLFKDYYSKERIIDSLSKLLN